MEMLTEYGPLAALLFVGVFGLAKLLIDGMAKRPEIDGWDEAKAIIDQMNPVIDIVEDWANPSSDSVPPSTKNPSGLA